MSMFTSTNKVAGLALMLGVVLTVAAFWLTPGRLDVGPDDLGDFRVAFGINSGGGALTHVMTMLTMLGVVLMAFGMSSLLRLPRERGLIDLALRFGVGIMVFAWGIYVIQMGIRHMMSHIVAHGIYPGMDQVARDEMGLTIFSVFTGMHFGFLVLSAFFSLLIGLWIVVRFDGFNLFVLAGYGWLARGVAEVVNIVVFQHLHDVDFGQVLTLSSGLLFLGSVWTFIIGYGIFTERRELVPPEGDDG